MATSRPPSASSAAAAAPPAPEPMTSTSQSIVWSLVRSSRQDRFAGRGSRMAGSPQLHEWIGGDELGFVAADVLGERLVAVLPDLLHPLVGVVAQAVAHGGLLVVGERDERLHGVGELVEDRERALPPGLVPAAGQRQRQRGEAAAASGRIEEGSHLQR